MTQRILTQEKLGELLEKLNGKLAKQKVKGEIYIVGGAVLCLVFDARPATRDVDAFFKPSKLIRELAVKIASEEELPEDWLNDAVKGYLSDRSDFDLYLEKSNLRVHTASAEYLLAMKCLSMRIGEEFQDLDDVQFLLRYLNISSYEKAVEVITSYYPQKLIPQKTFYALEELLSKKAKI